MLTQLKQRLCPSVLKGMLHVFSVFDVWVLFFREAELVRVHAWENTPFNHPCFFWSASQELLSHSPFQLDRNKSLHLVPGS